MVNRRSISLLAFFLLLSFDGAASGNVEFFVSPRGSDRNPGTKARPFATVQRAKSAVRKIGKEQETNRGPITVYLRGGRYALTETVVFTPGDGGTPESPVLYAAYNHERPILSGGTLIGKWNETSVNQKKVWVAPVPRVKSGPHYFHQLWVNDQRRTRARHPDHGYFSVEAVTDTNRPGEWTEGDASFRYRDNDLPPWPSVKDGEVVVMNRWVESRLPIAGIDRDRREFHFGKRSVFRLDRGDLYYVENVREALDTPGEWYLDRTQGLLYYLPLPGEQLGQTEAVAPILPQLIRIEGDLQTGHPVEYLSFRGISFSHTEWYFAGDTTGIGGFPQAAVKVPAAIQCNGVRNCSFEDCIISHVGTYGIELGRGCRQSRIVRSSIYDLGAGGIKIGEVTIRRDTAEQTGGNEVLDCRIFDGGRLFHSAIGVWIGQSYNNMVIHNQIHDFYYTGISVGWTWGYDAALAWGNRIEWNHIDHIGVLRNGDGPVLSDMAAIYTLGRQPGTRIRYNLIHDIAGLRYGGWGIYFDEGSTHIVAEQNIVYQTTHGGFHQHYGRENRVCNNVFALARDAQIMRTRPENHTSFAFEHNIVYWSGGSLLGGNFSGSNFLFDDNLYWHEHTPILFDTLAVSEWMARGNDVHSVIADPLFVDPARHDFRLRQGSPADRIGFHPIPVEKILQESPFTDADWKSGQTSPRKRMLYNSDGTNIFIYRDRLSPRDVFDRVDEVANAGATTFLISPNPGQNMAYPGKVCAMFHYDGIPSSRIESTYVKISNNLKSLVEVGYDPTGMLIDRARLRGIEAFISFRMNELHDVDKPGSPLLSAFWKQHPEYRVGAYEGWGASALNYALPEVRDYYFRLLEEVCDRFDLDGLELDFMRFPYYFPANAERRGEYSELMTGFLERIRAMTITRGIRRGRPILLSSRIPSSLEGCKYVGLDPATWCKRGLVDFLTVAPFLSTEMEISVNSFKAVCPGIPIYAGIEYTIGSRMMTNEEARAASSSLYANGADGIYSFNYFCSREDGQEPDFAVFADISSPDSLLHKNKLYAFSAAKYPVPNVSLTHQLPITLTNGAPRTITLSTPGLAQPARTLLRVESLAIISPEDIRVSFNGTQLHEGTVPPYSQIFVRKVPYQLPSTEHCLEFALDPALLRDSNLVTFAAKKTIVITWLYLAVLPQSRN